MTLAGKRQTGSEGTGRHVKEAGSAPVRRRPTKKSRVAVETASDPSVHREQKIAEAAYLRAEQRNFESGRELDDWLAAELEIDSLRPAYPESIDDANIISPIP